MSVTVFYIVIELIIAENIEYACRYRETNGNLLKTVGLQTNGSIITNSLLPISMHLLKNMSAELKNYKNVNYVILDVLMSSVIFHKL